MLMTIPNGYKVVWGAYYKRKDGDIGKLVGHDKTLKLVMNKHPNCIYGSAIIKK